MIYRRIRTLLILLPGLTQSHVAVGRNELIGGSVADLKDYPASVKAVGTDGSSCTSTIIGERTLLTASHCVSQGGSVNFKIGAQSYSAICTQSDGWRDDIDHDIALCFIDKPVNLVLFENINKDSKLVQAGDKVLLSGFGCKEVDGKDTPDGLYRVGEAEVTGIPSLDQQYSYSTKGGAALCFGDSGGPAFKLAADGGRSVIGVNSAGDIATDSYLTSTSSQASIDFLNNWSSKQNTRICGLHSDAKGCLTSKPSEDKADGKCSESLLSVHLATWNECLKQSNPDLVSCDAANDKLQDCYASK